MLRKLIFIALIISCSMKELFEDYYQRAEEIISNMTFEQKVGQLFFARFNNTFKDSDITTKFPGGFVLFAYDFDYSSKEVIKNMKYIKKLYKKTLNLSLGLSVDEEGGTVTRISSHKMHRSEPFPSPHDIYFKSGLEGLLKIEKEKRDLLRKFKMNVNLAPVADFSNNPNDYIYKRTLGYPLSETIDYISKEVIEYNNDNFTCCAKHFPGYGNNIDTHGEIAYDNRSYETFEKEDLKPFEAAIKEEIPMILISHNIVTCKDPVYPASISEIWHNILRNDLSYSGIIITDDLSMQAIQRYAGNYSPAIIAVNAGNDIILTSQFHEHLSAVMEAVKNGTISDDTIYKACRRIIAWKLKYLINDENEEEEEDDDDEDDDNNTSLIICLTIVGVVVLMIFIFLILKFYVFKKNKSKGTIDESLTAVENND